jgi:pimeloyl-ACP methyl ester carboxylesterase
MEFISVAGAQLETRFIAGSDALAPLVFLHEGLGSVAMWQTKQTDWPLAICQQTGRQAWVYSRRGYGQSDTIADIRGKNRLKPDYMHQHAWQELPELMDKLKLKKPILIGHSDGGSIALLHAARHAVTAAVVMAPHLFVEEMSLQAIEAARQAYLHGDLRSKLARFHLDVDCAFWQWNDIWLSPEFRAFDIQQACLPITAPVLALQGEDDAYGSLRHVLELVTQGEVKQAVLKACGHSPHRDQYDISLAHVTGFLNALP